MEKAGLKSGKAKAKAKAINLSKCGLVWTPSRMKWRFERVAWARFMGRIRRCGDAGRELAGMFGVMGVDGGCPRVIRRDKKPPLIGLRMSGCGAVGFREAVKGVGGWGVVSRALGQAYECRMEMRIVIECESAREEYKSRRVMGWGYKRNKRRISQ